MAESSLHVVVFPWLAFGHLIPFLELSKCIAKRGHHVSFLSTPRNIRRLPKLPPSLAPSIDFVPIPLPPCEGLPDGVEATSDLPQEKVKYLNKAFDGLEQSVAEFLVRTSPKPSRIIHDYAPLAASGCSRGGRPVCLLQHVPILRQRVLHGTRWKRDAAARRGVHYAAGVDPLSDQTSLSSARGPQP
ncbi:hypothetical protein OPV22_012875 [Ensete ventricosum]|uniref:Uncharacterized protein n=1 Tax=Ensete ventricosum TaxID=4639 RepID=A0AAV8PHH7_ENSVE|nr:hypothetical protein OPV22_012875 [Ensete ventricosum]